jgi:repressor LexA
MTFNINDYVKVRLTDVGRQLHRKNWEDIIPETPLKIEFLNKYQPPSEDNNGWSEWQMWDLMSEFGRYMYLNCNPPFETEIEIVEK